MAHVWRSEDSLSRTTFSSLPCGSPRLMEVPLPAEPPHLSVFYQLGEGHCVPWWASTGWPADSGFISLPPEIQLCLQGFTESPFTHWASSLARIFILKWSPWRNCSLVLYVILAFAYNLILVILCLSSLLSRQPGIKNHTKHWSQHKENQLRPKFQHKVS